MLTFAAGVLRVFFGFIVASLAAGIVQVLFAVTPTELVSANDDRLGLAFTWGLLSATQIAVFAAPFAAISALLSEWQALRSFAYHAIVAMAISVAGFGLLYATETPTEATIVNSYAMAAYLTSGFVGGLIYWLFAGRLAGGRDASVIRMESGRDGYAQSGTRQRPHRPETEAPTDHGSQPDDTRAGRMTENQRIAAKPRSTGTVPATKPPPSRPADEAKRSDTPSHPPKLPSAGTTGGSSV